MISPIEIPNAIAGCILGGAIGDALGGAYEGQSPPIEVITNTVARISDNTQLTHATCEAIIEAKCVDPATIAAVFVRWFKARRFRGLGACTLKALQELAAGQHWALAGAKGDRAAGNGAAMRIAPIAFFCNPEDDDDRALIRNVCRITHHNEEAYAAALAVVIAIRYSAFHRDAPMHLLPKAVAKRLPDSVTRDRLREISTGDLPSIHDLAVRHGTTGYAADTVPLAIIGASHVNTLGLKSMLCDLISCGGDTDTIASIAGQIAGTRLGLDGVVADLAKPLSEYHELLRVSQQLRELV
ncbi:MAG: ADP-ribosylglycohydrolase family protein [Phycisphaerales bacterium]|nr:ADP-ribosylglycohydrolase family protein [Phycisphaerales bacterium]